jgi:hypothetical protein
MLFIEVILTLVDRDEIERDAFRHTGQDGYKPQGLKEPTVDSAGNAFDDHRRAKRPVIPLRHRDIGHFRRPIGT